MNIPRCKCYHLRIEHEINNGSCEKCKCIRFDEVPDWHYLRNKIVLMVGNLNGFVIFVRRNLLSNNSGSKRKCWLSHNWIKLTNRVECVDCGYTPQEWEHKVIRWQKTQNVIVFAIQIMPQEKFRLVVIVINYEKEKKEKIRNNL